MSTAKRRHPRKSRGFTLIEAAVVLALITILVAMSIGGLELMKARANFSSAAGDMVGGLRRVEADAWGNGVYTAFVVDEQNGKWWALDNVESDFSVGSSGTFSTTDPTNGGTRTLVSSGTFPSGMSFGAYGASLSAPFTSVPMTTSAGAAMADCSFCIASDKIGAIVFDPGADIHFSNPASNALGQQFSLTGSMKDGSSGAAVQRKLAVVVVPSTGVIETFE